MTLKTLILLLVLVSSSLACSPYCKYCAEDGVTCDGCYAGYIFSSDSDTPTSCEPCPGGYTSEESSHICTACPAGSYSAFGQLICLTCPSGYSSEEGSEACTRCPNGSYATAGQLCQPCPAGTYAVDDGSYCEYCPVGSFSAGGTKSCSLCPEGSVPDVYQWGCVDCGQGFWASPGDSECINCGQYCEICGSSTTCKECENFAENVNGKCLFSCSQGEGMKVIFDDCVDGACGQGCQECAYDGYDCFSCFSGGDESEVLSRNNQYQYLVCALPENPIVVGEEESGGEISLKSVSESSGSGLDVTSVIAKSLSAGSSVAFRFGVVAEVVRNARYFSIAYSEKTVSIFTEEDSEPFEINAPGSFDETDSKELHKNFVKYDVEPSFLINYWSNLITILILSACLGALKVLEIHICSQNKKRIWTRRVIRILKISAANFLINNLYGSFDQILLFLIFEIQTCNFGSTFSWSSFICALVFLIIGLGFFGFNFYILRKYQKAKSQQRDQENNDERGKLEMFKSKHAHIKVFYEDFKDDCLIKQSFLASLMIRSCILNVLLCLLVDNPLVEACLYLGVNLAFAIFLVFKRPFEEFKNAAAQYFCEIIILITYSGVLALAIMDHNGAGASNSRESLEKAIVILGIVLNIGGVIFQCIEILAAIYEAYQEFKAFRSKAKVAASPPAKALAKNAAEDMKESARPLNLDDPTSTPSNQNLSEGVGAGLVSLSGLSFRIKSRAGLEMPFPSTTSQSLNNLLTSVEGSQSDLDKEKEEKKPVLSRAGTIREEGADVTMSPYKNGVSQRVMRRQRPFRGGE